MTKIQTTTSTGSQYDGVVQDCRDIFLKKTADYGTAWRVLRPISIIDQIYIKAQRIRTLQEKKLALVPDDISTEFRGIINYAVIGLMQLELGEDEPEELSVEECARRYDKAIGFAREIMEKKNHDYGEAWRQMSQEGLTDLILMKLQRVRQIIRNEGKTLISEGIDANYTDIINYAVFALIMESESPAL